MSRQQSGFLQTTKVLIWIATRIVKSSVLTPPLRSLGLNHVFFWTKYNFLFTKYDLELSVVFITKRNHEGLKHFRKLVMFLIFKVFMVKEIVPGLERLLRWSANFKSLESAVCLSIIWFVPYVATLLQLHLYFIWKNWRLVRNVKRQSFRMKWSWPVLI